MSEPSTPTEANDAPDFRLYDTFFKENAKEVSSFPSEILSVSEEKKELRALDRTLFEDNSANYGFVAFSKSYLAQEWCVMSAKGENAKIKSKSMVASKLPEYSFEIDEASLVNSSSESVDASIQRWNTEEQPSELNHDFTPILPLVAQVATPVMLQSTPQAKPYQERLGEEVAIEAQELSFAFGAHEPFFCTLALYDAKEQRKISEDFVFQVNTPEQLNLVGVQVANLASTVRNTRRCVFRLSPTSKHADIYALLIVSKVLSGDLEESYELYSKSSLKDKELKKAVSAVQECCSRLSKYKQNFAWGAAPIFEADGSYRADSNYIMELCKIKGDMWSLIDEVKTGKKLRTIPGTFKFSMSTKPNSQIFMNRLTPTLAPVQPFDDSNATRTKEVQEFTSTSEYPYPWVNYVNNYYLYLQKADLSAFSGRNICIEVKFMDRDDDLEGPGMPIIYADSMSTSGPLVDRYISSVAYHSQIPKMLDEIAIKLPTQVTDKHHLLISFYHINVAVKKGSEETKTLVARTFVPLLKDHQIIRQKNVIRIASKLLPGYMTKEESVSWMDNKKAALTIYARVISSVYPLEGALHKFLRSCEWDPKSDWTKIIAAMKGLFDEKTNRRQTVRYLPVVMRTLFQHLLSSSMAICREAFDTLLAILESISNLTKPEDGILEAYLNYVFNAEANNSKLGSAQLYERILEQWMAILNDKDEYRSILSLKYSWFLVGIALKSMIFHLQIGGGLLSPTSGSSKKTKTSESKSSESKSSESKTDLKAESKQDLKQKESKLEIKLEKAQGFLGADWNRIASNFTKACGDFVRDNYKNVGYAAHLPAFHVQLARLLGEAIPMMDKGVAFEIIWDYFGKLNLSTIDMFTYKALMLKIWIQRVDFAALNIPLVPTFSNVRDIPRLFLQRHFFVGLILKQLEFAYVTNNHTTRILILDVLCDALYTHECDPKLSSKQKTKIIQTYFPFILMVIDRADILKQAPEDEKYKSYACMLCILRHTSPTFLTNYLQKEAERRIFIFFELLKLIVDQFEWYGLEDTLEELKHIGFVVPNPRFSLSLIGAGQVADSEGDTVLTSDSRGQLAKQASNMIPRPIVNKDKKKVKIVGKTHTPSVSSGSVTTSNSSNTLSVSSTSLAIAALPPPLSPPTSPAASLPSSIPAPLTSPRSSTSPRSPSDAISSRKSTFNNGTPKSKESKRVMKKDGGLAKEAIMASNLSFQSSVIVLDIINTFINNFEIALQRRDVFEQTFQVLIYLFSVNQSTAFLSILMRRWYFLIPKFGHRLFLKRNSICGELVREVLIKCNSRVLTTRSEACTLLIQIFKCNYQMANNVDRTRLQATIGITKLVGQSQNESFGRLFNSFASIKKHLQVEEKEISQVVDQLDTKIRAIITDNLKIQQFEYDPETIVDLYYGISKQLLDHPDERITWLDNLAEYHKARLQLEEYAQTKILTAALVQQYLSALNRWEAKMVPVFGLVCPSVQEEIDMPQVQSLLTLKDEVCQASVFSADGFANLVKDAIEMLKQAGLLELAVAAYRMLLPIYQMSEDYKTQQLCHHDLYTLCGQLNDENQMKQRIFSNYYRVTFHGQKFGADLDGHSFIYREKNTCRLAEFTERLKDQYSRAFGPNSIVILPNAQVVNPAELDASKCYLQIATVELFLSQEQQMERNSAFKQHFGANRFVMEQPFTRAGSLRGEIEDQCLRRTIFTTSRAFPFAAKRLKICAKEDQELSPIEYAHALISKKLQQLRGEMSVATPNLKTLQRELQGTLLTQVNAGAGAIIQTFLSDASESKYPVEMREKLADIVIEFDRALLFATKLNKNFMDPTADQTLLQEELEKGHQRFHASLEQCTIIASRHANKRRQVVQAEQQQAEMANKKLDGPKKIKSAFIDAPTNSPPASSPNTASKSSAKIIK